MDHPAPTPGVHNFTAAEYHADPVPGGSLSSTGARRLLPPSCPAKFRYQQEHPAAPKTIFDLGHIAHQLALGAGPEPAVVEANDWRTKAAKEAAACARSEGRVPLLRADHRRVLDMAAALRQHPLASALFVDGLPEQTLVWQDEPTGVWCRAMVDWLPNVRPGRRMLVVDYKTTDSAEPEALRRACGSYRYHQQAAWYLSGVTALGLDDDPAFVFVGQEKEPPYLVTPFQIHPDDLRRGAGRNQQAREIYRDCAEADLWPGYTDDVVQLTLPYWVQRQDEEALAS
jgi:hypothetical protein